MTLKISRVLPEVVEEPGDFAVRPSTPLRSELTRQNADPLEMVQEKVLPPVFGAMRDRRSRPFESH
jgi:hypothetical protein